MLEIYMADIGPLEQEELFKELMEQVSSHRRERVLACKNEKDRCRALAAGFLLKKALQKYGVDEQKIQYEVNSYGKPMLPEHLDMYFNLSHAKEYAVCVLSSENVGVDLESVSDRFSGEKGERRFTSLIQKALTQEEKELLEDLDLQEKISLFCRIWTKKESFCKEDGRGMMLPFSEIDTIKSVYSVDQEIRPGYWLSVYQKHPQKAEVIFMDLSKKEAV